MSNHSAQNFKAKTKTFHDKYILKKEFLDGQKVLLYNSRLHLFSRELRSKWYGPFETVQVFPYGAIETLTPKNRNQFKVNGQRLKHFIDGIPTLPLELSIPSKRREDEMGE